jgi:hypothetical protein
VETTALVDTLEQLYGSLGGLCGELRPEEWELPTGCPGWTVKDNLSHVAGLDSELCGEPVPEVDLWSHEQDIRRATGRTGHLDGEVAEVSFRAISRQLGVALSEAGLPAGTRMAIEITGPVRRRFELVVGEPHGDGAGQPAATVRLDLPDFVARACGRRDGHGDLLGTLEVTGDAEVGARLVEHLAVTP